MNSLIDDRPLAYGTMALSVSQDGKPYTKTWLVSTEEEVAKILLEKFNIDERNFSPCTFIYHQRTNRPKRYSDMDNKKSYLVMLNYFQNQEEFLLTEK